MFLKEVTTIVKEAFTYRDRIVQDSRIMVGKPVVKGTRIPVELVLEELAYNPDLSELFAAHPALSIDDVKACLAYAQELVKRQRPRREAVSASVKPSE